MNLANRITILRILLIPFFVMSLILYKPHFGLFSYLPIIIFSVCVLTDALDGFIARHLGQKTKLGTILDPIADKMLILTAFISLTVSSSLPPGLKLPSWALLVVISRDILIILGSVLIIFITGNLYIKPSILGKITTFFQMATIISILMQFDKSYLLWNTMAIFTVISGIDYLLKGSNVFNEQNHNQQSPGFHINIKNLNNFKV